MSFKENKLFTFILLSTFCILNTIPSVFGNCNFRLTSDSSLRPKLLQKIGSHYIDFTHNESDEYILMYDEQEMEAICNNNFESPVRFKTKNKINIKCTGNRLYLNDDYNYYYNHNEYDYVLRCSSKKWNLYETIHYFEWCPPNSTSYILASPEDSSPLQSSQHYSILRTSNEKKYQYLAGICYDTYNLSFKSLYHRIAPKYSEHVSPNGLSDFYNVGIKLEYISQTFGKKSIKETDYDNEDIREWMQFSKYEFKSVVQNSHLYSKLSITLGSMLDIAWWPNLRLGNWKRFEKALTKHVETEQETYDLISGVSGIATAPSKNPCQTNYTLKELTGANRRNEIPMYVWNYLRSTNSSSKEIVVIAINSPFYEANDVFCPDICNEISWLENVSKTFRYSALGVIFCCTYDDVKLSQRLEGFPDRKPGEIIDNNNVSQSLDELFVTTTDEMFSDYTDDFINGDHY